METRAFSLLCRRPLRGANVCGTLHAAGRPEINRADASAIRLHPGQTLGRNLAGLFAPGSRGALVVVRFAFYGAGGLDAALVGDGRPSLSGLCGNQLVDYLGVSV